MKRLGMTLILVLCFALQVQAASVSEASQLASQLGNSPDFPRNVQLRFQVLAARMEAFNEKKPPDLLLGFFSSTRVMAWNHPVSPNTQSLLQSLEQQMVALANQKGRPLDLPPVGYSPSSNQPTQSKRLMVATQRATPEVLVNVARQAENSATEALATQNSAELLFLRDNLTRFREDVADGTVAANTVRSVMGARARFLASPAATGASPGLIESLTMLGEVLHVNFPPETLRQASGGDLTL